MYEFDGSIPGDSLLEIKCMDYDIIGGEHDDDDDGL
jgi:hypothetical protein